MMKLYQPIISISLLILTVSCGEKQQNKWCDDHKSTHSAHLASVSQVKIEYAESGLLSAQIKIPKSDADDYQLNDIEKIITVNASQTCQNFPAKVNSKGDYWLAEYNIDCGANNKLNEVSVAVLKNFSDIKEVEANISTPAVSKHFVLSRQCNKPIFSL